MMADRMAAQATITGNVTDLELEPTLEGKIEAISVSNEGTTPNAGRTVTVKAEMDEILQTVWSQAIGAGTNVVHPHKQAVDATNAAITGVYVPFNISGRVFVTVSGASAGDKTRVRVTVNPN